MFILTFFIKVWKKLWPVFSVLPVDRIIQESLFTRISDHHMNWIERYICGNDIYTWFNKGYFSTWSLAIGHWAFGSFYGTRCSQICLSDRQTIAFQCAKPNAQSNLYHIRYFFCVAAILETFRFRDEDDYEYEIWLKVFSRILKI